MLSHELNDRFSDPVAFGGGEDILIRSFRASDRPEVLNLYQKGRLAGHADPLDRASDLADIEGTYFRRPQDHFWVAEAKDSVVGTIAVSEDDATVAHLRRLRVAPFWQLDDSLAIGLIRTAISHARFHGCPKLVFHTSLDGPRATELLQGLGLQFARIRDVAGVHLIEFYDDLYAIHASGGSAGSSIHRPVQ
jgi:ribosomal protein S18 acetylase RimI-like enzyme